MGSVQLVGEFWVFFVVFRGGRPEKQQKTPKITA
jgi:hypothetical protein